jgi:predicted dehydrogenase
MDVTPLRIGIVGAGKIARDQHIPAIRNCDAFALVGCTHSTIAYEGVRNFPDLLSMLEALPELEAVSLCCPPQARYEAAVLALEWHKHVLLEKPPCATVEQLDSLTYLAKRMDRTLYQTWHLAELRAIREVQNWLATRNFKGGRILWREDVKRWHPGQTWLWQKGGFGVFDAGINALSILTTVLPEALTVRSAELMVPVNCETPIAANVLFEMAGKEITAEFDFRGEGETVWQIEFRATEGTAILDASRNRLIRDGHEQDFGAGEPTYATLYRRFAELIRANRSEIDTQPLRLVEDIFRLGRHIAVAPIADVQRLG